MSDGDSHAGGRASAGRVDWRFRGAFGEVEIEVHPGPVDAQEREASVREVRQLVSDFTYRDPEARRAVLSILARLGGLDARMLPPACDFDTGSPRAQALGDQLLRAASAGVIHARRRGMRSIVVRLDGPAQNVLGPEPAALAPDDFIRILLFDSTGAPMPSPLDALAVSVDVSVVGLAPFVGLPLVGGMAEVPSISPGGNPSACTLLFSGFQDGGDTVPGDAPPAADADVAPSLMRGPPEGPTLLTRRQLAQPQRGMLGATNVFQLQRRGAQIFELEHFSGQSSVFLPGPCPPEVDLLVAEDLVTGIEVLRASLSFAQDYALREMLVTGHGPQVSQQRADNVSALLTGDRKRWVDLVLAHSTVADYQWILTWASTEYGWPCDPGAITNNRDQATHDAVLNFQRAYNADRAAGLFAQPNAGAPIGVDGSVGKQTWGAMFDCYMRAIRPVADPSAGPSAYIIVDDKHQTYPVELAEIAAPGADYDARARHWQDLNPLNPQMVIPNGGGWYPPQVGQRIYVPDSWNLGALAAAAYETHPAAQPPSPVDAGPASLRLPGPLARGCGEHHMHAPFANAENRRATDRHVEVLFFDDAPPDFVCFADTPDPCTALTCELYDPREFTLVYRDPLAEKARTFRFAIPVGPDAWPDSANLYVLDGHDVLWSGLLTDGEPFGDYRMFDVPVSRSSTPRAYLNIEGTIFEVFGQSPLYDIVDDASSDDHLVPPDYPLHRAAPGDTESA